eukprot:gene12952-32847_t
MAEEEPASTDLALALATHAALFRQLQKRQASTDDQGIAVKYDVNSRCSRSGLTPLFVSCLKGDPASVQLLLAFGADAAAESKASIKEIMEAIATSKAEPTALPWQDAPPLCKNTVKLVADATRGWSRTNHWLHHGKVREAVLTVLVVTLRLERKDALLEAAVATAAAAAGKADQTDCKQVASQQEQSQAAPPPS